MNQTGLDGVYDCDPKWTPESGDLLEALQAARLKLVAQKGTMNILVLDHVALPTEN